MLHKRLKDSLNVDEMKIDCMSISGHKIYGPKRRRDLRSRRPRVRRMEPIINDGGQERFEKWDITDPVVGWVRRSLQSC